MFTFGADLLILLYFATQESWEDEEEKKDEEKPTKTEPPAKPKPSKALKAKLEEQAVGVAYY